MLNPDKPECVVWYPFDFSADEGLRLYGSSQQVIIGDVRGQRPFAFNIEGNWKYDKWASYKGWTREEAMKEFINVSTTILQRHGYSTEDPRETQMMKSYELCVKNK